MMSGFQMLDFLTSYSKLICLNGNLKVAKIQMNPIDNPCKRKDSLELIKFKSLKVFWEKCLMGISQMLQIYSQLVKMKQYS